MSRIGKKPIKIAEGVTLEPRGNELVVRGPKGELVLTIPKDLDLKIENDEARVTRKADTKITRSLHGSFTRVLANAIHGVTQGWEKNLELVGTGYRARIEGDKLILSLGFIHPVTFDASPGITFSLQENAITVSGADRHLVGQVAANIKAARVPDAYKGKGVRYLGEYIHLKPGKAAAKAAV